MKIHVYELKIGMYVSKLEIPWEQSPFLLQGFEIKKHVDIQAVQNVCNYVYIDINRQKNGRDTNARRSKQPFLDAFNGAESTFQQTSSLVKNMMDDIRFGNQLNSRAAKKAVADCVDQVLESPDAMLLLTQLKNQDEYTSQHSLNVCILSILVARHLGYSIKKLNHVGLCGLLHDMGKMKVPPEILNKPGKLTNEEQKIMRSHTTLGRNIIMSAHDIFPGAVDVAYNHHEKLDGSGYPRGLKEDRISEFTKVVTIVDSYDAISSDRVYRKGRLHLDAINILTKNRDIQFDSSILMKFIDCIGIYPVGNPVEMSNGEIGVVIESNLKNKTQPVVLMLMDMSKKYVDNFLLELASNPVDANKKPYKIKKVLRKDEYGLNLYEFNRQGRLKQALTTLGKK